MARIRSIKPEFWSDASIVKLPFEYRLLFQGMWNFADDAGFIENDPVQIKLHVFPADSVDVAKGVRALKASGLIEVVRLDGKSVIRVANWKHQRIDKPQPSKFAALYAEYQGLPAIPRTFQERSKNVPAGGEGIGEERKGKEDTQVGGGGHLSSDTTQPPPPISSYEPWRCDKHQGVDVSCYACKQAKADHKTSEAQRVAEAKARKLDAESQPRRDREAEAAATEPAPRELIEAAKARVKATVRTTKESTT